MNLIEIIRAKTINQPEPVVPGESLVVEPGDRIVCGINFAEISSLSRHGDDLHFVVGELSVTHFRQFFKFEKSHPEPLIQFQDQQFSASQLSLLLTVTLTLIENQGAESQVFLLPGSFLSAHPGDVFTVNSKEFVVKDLHREGDHLVLYSHDLKSSIAATIREFFISTAEGVEAPELRITDASDAHTQDIIIHPTNPIFQWQGEPLPQAVAGALYAYYFHLDAENADKIILTAKTSDGELPTWLTFSHFGEGKYLLTGLPTAEAIGTYAISIIATSTSQGMGMHTQQAFNLKVHPASEPATRNTADDVAAAEFRKAGETFNSENYLGMASVVHDVPYMSMPEIAVMVGLPTMDMFKVQQEFSSTLTPEQIVNPKGLADQGELNSKAVVVHALEANSKIIEESHTTSSQQEVSHIINKVHVEITQQPLVESPTTSPPEQTTPIPGPEETTQPQNPSEVMMMRIIPDAGPGNDTAVSHNLLITSPPPPPPDYSTPPESISQEMAVPENSSNGTVVGTMTATDADPGDILTYSFYTPTTAFSIDPVTGVITVADMSQLNYETTSSYLLDVQVNDLGGNFVQVNAAVFIGNINDNAPVVDLNGAAPGIDYSVNFSGSFVNLGASTATVTDADSPDFSTLDSIVVTITNDLDGLNEGLGYNFNLYGGGNVSGITLGDQLSFGGPSLLIDMQSFLQNITYFNNSSTPTTTDRIITIQAYDGVNYSTIATTTVTYTINNNQPLISPQIFSIDENNINNTIVGTVIASDNDSGDSIADYSIIGGTGASAFTINSATGVITVLNSDYLNYEMFTSFTLDVQVTDTHGATNNALMTININNVNDIAPTLDLNGVGTGTDLTVNYFGPVHLATSTVTITDGDAPGFPNLQSITITITNILDPGNEILSYSFVDSNSVLQSGSSSSGVLTFTGPFSIADMEAFLKSVTYQDTALTPNTASRFITIVANDGVNDSNITNVEITHGFTFNDFNGTNGMIFIGESINLNGLAVTGADINGDGYQDVIMAAPTVGFSGQVQVLLGGPGISSVGSGGIVHASDLNGATGFVINETSTSNGLLGVGPGTVGIMGAAGDVNGDGVQDLLIGTYNGPSFLVFGAISLGNSGSIDLNNFDGSQAFLITGVPGTVVGTVGDVNGDGFQDFFIGSPSTSQNAVLAGSTEIIFGSPTVNLSNALDVSALNGSNGFQFLGANAIDFAGYSVASAGDINNDGYLDLAVGTFQNNHSYIIFGGPNIGSSGTIQAGYINGSNGFVITNSNSTVYDRFIGSTITNIGDVNGDGISDLLVDSPNTKHSYSPDGAVYIIFGNSNLNFTGGTFDVASITPFTGAIFHSYSPIGYSSGVRAEASAAGDMNGDGLNDFAFTAVDRVTGLQKLYILFGSTNLGFQSTDLNNLTPSEGLVIYTTNSTQSITSLASLGDVNGDGIDDLAVGMGFSNLNGINSGETVIIFGSNFTNAITQLGDTNGNILNGTAGVDRIYGAQGDDIINTYAGADYISGGAGTDTVFAGDDNDTINGGADNDVLHGGNNDDLLMGGPGSDSLFGEDGNDTIVYENNDNLIVDGGNGIDTLWIRDGSTAADLHGGIAVDLRGTSIYSNIEVIDLRGDTLAPTSVTLDVATVLSMTDAAHTLTVLGSDRDTVGLQPGEFTFVGTFITSFGAVDRYTGGGATVDVLSTLTVSQVSTLDLDGDNSSGSTGIDYNANFVGSPINLVDSDAILTDLDGNIIEVIVRITNLQDGAQESLSATPTGNISVSYSPTGVLLLSGIDTPANYLTVLQSIQYHNTAASPSTTNRQITFEVSDTGGVSEIASTIVTFNIAPNIYTLSTLMDGIQGFELTSTAAYTSTGSTIVQDGDGSGNLLVAQYNNLSPYSRAIYIPGSPTFPANVPFNHPSLNMTSFNNDSLSTPVNAPSSSVVSVSDFNGDGILDYLIAPVNGGPAFIVSGSSSLPASVALSSLGYGPYSNNFATKVRGDTFSSSAALGDADGDGFGDVILGNPSGGQAYVIFSNAEVFADFDVSYITLFSNYGIHITGLGIANNSFNNVTGVNFNGDTMNDIFVGFTDTISNIGSIGVIFGSATLHGDTVSITSFGVSGANGFLIVNSAAVATDYLAMPTNIGNFTGSGFDDIAIASKDTVYVIFGNTSFTAGSTFDVNTLNGSNGFSLTSSQPGAHITSISYVGDVNADGIPDFAFVDSGAYSGAGAIYVIFGSRDPFSSNIDYTLLDQNNGIVIKDPSGILSSATVGGGGDLNGDGISDIVITAGGNVFTVFGSNFSNTVTDMGTQGADVITKTSGENVIFGLAGNDIITGGDNPDYIDGGTGADTINAGGSSDTVIYDGADISVNGGAAPDTLWFKYDHTHADLRDTLVFSGFEIINLTPLITLTGNSIILDAATVTAMSDENTITIYGNGHDKVTIMAADNWTSSTGFPGFTTYTAHSGAFINVQDGVDVFIQPRMLVDFIDGVNGFALDAAPIYFHTLGWGVAIVQDINGDGFGELLTANRNYYNDAKADIIFGQSSLPTAHIHVTDPGVMGTEFFTGTGFLGGFVAGINDFNGDGYKDIFIPAKFGYHSYIVYGDPSGYAPSVNLPTLGTAGLDIGTSASGFGAGFTTGDAMGDLNGDGLGDVALGNGVSGSVFVVLGTLNPSTSIDVTTLNGTDGFKIFTPGWAGNSDSAELAGVDINGDGFTDVFSKTTSNIANQTYISVILGHSSPFPATVDTSTLSPGTGFHIFNSAYGSGYNALGRFGLANLGDINGSGIDAVGIHGSTVFNHSANIGNAAAYIVFGDPAFSTSGNFDLTTLNGSNGFGLVAPEQSFSYLSSISGAGDFNGDGIADFAFIDSESFGTGALFVIFGSTDPMPALIDYTHLTPSQGVAFQFSGVYSGFSVGGGGDFNGDGLSDVVVGSPFASIGETANGAAYVIFGGDFSNSITQLGTSGVDNITATSGDDNIVAAQGSDTINALAGNDLINGGSGADIIDAGADNDRIIFDANDSSVNGSTGIDTLWFKEDGTRANLVGTSVFIGIDVIDLHSLQTLTGNEVSLDAATVAAMSDANILTVNGDAHGILHLVATDNWVASAGAPGYTTYTSLSGSVINVENDIRVMFGAPGSPVTLSFTVAQLTDGDRGFDLTPIIHRPIPPQYAATSATIVHDGDGFDNILIANGFVAGDTPFARAFMIDGQSIFSSPIPFNDPSMTLTTFNNDSFSSPIAAYGQFVASVGDFNGDGVNDILISEFFGGNAHLVLGGYTSPVVLSTSSIEILGNETNSLAGLGDVNGDGLADFMLSNSNTGFGAVIFGDATPGTSINMMTLTGADGFQIARPNPAFTPGVHDITGANFVGDGKNDVFVSYYDNGLQTGGIAVILGSTPVFSSTVTITSSGITGANGFLITNSAGIPGSDNYLINPTNIGNFSGSGFDDIALSSKDTVYVIFGSAIYASVTGFDVATQLDGTSGFALTSTGPADITSIASVNDVNGDGLSDFAVMDRAANGGLGVVHVIFGSEGPMPSSIDMSNLNSTQGFDIKDPFGFPSNYTVGGLIGNASVSGGGDVNGDGLADIVITSNSHEYVVFGGNFNGAITQLGGVGNDNLYGTAGDDNIVGAQGNDTINSLAGNDFINGGTGTDIINGGAGNDRIIFDQNDSHVDGGVGSDTLWFKDDNTLANLSGSSIFTGIDVIDLHALQSISGNHLILDAAEVHNMSDNQTLTVNGGGHDTLQLSAADGWVISTPLAGYTTYTSAASGGAVVNVENTLHYVHLV